MCYICVITYLLISLCFMSAIYLHIYMTTSKRRTYVYDVFHWVLLYIMYVYMYIYVNLYMCICIVFVWLSSCGNWSPIFVCLFYIYIFEAMYYIYIVLYIFIIWIILVKYCFTSFPLLFTRLRFFVVDCV
jgi:hypothetical protein